MKEFWKGYGLGMLAVVPAAVATTFGGPIVGLVMLVLAAGGSLTIAPVTAPRVGGVAAGVMTLFAAGFGLLLILFANMDM